MKTKVMNLTIKPSPELTELSKITGLTEYDLSNKIIHILDIELNCIEHWDSAGEMVSDVMLACGFRRVELVKRLPISTTPERYSHLVTHLQLWGTATEYACPDCGTETEIDHTEDLVFCINPNCNYKYSQDHTDYDIKRKFNKENN